MKPKIAFLMFIILVVSPAGLERAFSQIILVPGDFTTIQEGMDAATPGDTVLVEEGTYFENLYFNGKAITLASRFIMDGDTSHISHTIIDGSQSQNPDTASVITFWNREDSTSAVIGFTITGGSGTFIPGTGMVLNPSIWAPNRGGGGILIVDAGCRIENNVIRNNSIVDVNHDFIPAGGGIGIFLTPELDGSGLSVIIRNNRILQNELRGRLPSGGGIFLDLDPASGGAELNIAITGNLIEANRLIGNHTRSGPPGAGICSSMKLPAKTKLYRISENIIRNNSIELQFANPEFYWDSGGGIYLSYTGVGQSPYPAPLVANNIFSGNTARKYGGAIGVYYWTPSTTGGWITPVIVNNTFVNNHAYTNNGGSGLYEHGGNVLVYNNIFWDHMDPAENLEFLKDGGNILAYHNTIKNGWPGEGNITLDPQIGEESFELKAGSLSIGRGVDSIEVFNHWYHAPAADISGNPRPNPMDGRVDQGAIETAFEAMVYTPDSAFLYALIDNGVDTNGDSLISYPEAEADTFLNISGEFTDLTGIEAFTSLKDLRITSASLTQLALPNLQSLETFMIEAPSLAVLDVSVQENLGGLFCGGNHLVELKLPENLEFTSLSCRDNDLGTLDLSVVPSLSFLDCGGNNFTNLDLSNNPLIGTEGPPFMWSDTFLILNNMPTLEKVCVWEDIDLESLNLDTTGSPNVSFSTECGSNIVDIPDEKFLFALIDEEVDTNRDSLISYAEAYAVNELNLDPGFGGQRFESLTGIEAFVNLDSLNCGRTREINLHRNTKLSFLELDGFQLLSELDVSECISLNEIRLRSYPFASIDISVNQEIKKLYITGELSGINLSNNPDIVDLELECEIDSLDITHLHSLKSLVLYYHKMTALDLSNNPDLERLRLFECEDLNELHLSNNPNLQTLWIWGGSSIHGLDLSNNAELGDLYIDDVPVEELDLSHNTKLEYVMVVNCGLKEISLASQPGLKLLDVSANKLEKLDVSMNSDLTILICNNNELTEIVISSNLKILHCEGNRLTVLDLSPSSSFGTYIPNSASIWEYLDLNLSFMPSLEMVCVNEGFLPAFGCNEENHDSISTDRVCVDTTGSPNVIFTTECDTTLFPHYQYEEILVYPIPTKDLLTIETGYSEALNLTLTSLNGKVIMRKESEGTIHQLDLSSFEKGVYLITVRSTNHIFTRKIIKL